MEKFPASVECCSQSLGKRTAEGLGNLTTDAVHRRLLGEKKESNKKCHEKDRNDEDDYYYCEQCSPKINSFHKKEELKSHFETIKHKVLSSCNFCCKPMYEYRHKKKVEVYHVCSQDQ